MISHMDCAEFLGGMADGAADLAVVDPPYNLGVDSWDEFPSHGGFLKFTHGWLDLLIPKLRDGGSLYVFNTPFNSAYILCHLVGRGLSFQNWITWDKRDGLSTSTSRYAAGQETCLFFTAGTAPHTFNADDIRVPYESAERIAHAARKGIMSRGGKRWFPNPGGRLCGEVWHVTSERHKNKVGGRTVRLPHKTIKPLEMIERIVAASSNRGDLVVDCFLGSGTTALACSRLGRRFAGCDSNADYVEIARRRVETGMIFPPPPVPDEGTLKGFCRG